MGGGGDQNVLLAGLAHSNEDVRHFAGFSVDRLDVDDLIAATELLEASRHEHLMLGLQLRLLEERDAHRGHARHDEQRESRSHEREREQHPENCSRQPPDAHPARAECDDFAVPVESAETDEHREVKR